MSDSKTYIELSDDNGIYRITKENPCMTIDGIFEDLIVPLLLAAGYARESIDNYIGR